MTCYEAIEILIKIRNKANIPLSSKDWEAFDAAIKALEDKWKECCLREGNKSGS